jgi:hypothetical protein
MELMTGKWQAMISLVYNAGVTAGSEQRAAEIREALGFQTE